MGLRRSNEPYVTKPKKYTYICIYIFEWVGLGTDIIFSVKLNCIIYINGKNVLAH